MAAVAGERLARAPSGQLIELVVSAAGLSNFLVGLIDSLFAGKVGLSLLWVWDCACGRNGRSAAIAAPEMATVPAASVSAIAARSAVLKWAVIVCICLCLSWQLLLSASWPDEWRR